MHCVGIATGKVVGKKHLLKDFGGSGLPPAGVCQSPLLVKGALIVAPLTGQVGVVALERATGKVLWKSPALGQQMYASPLFVNAGGRGGAGRRGQPDPRRCRAGGHGQVALDVRRLAL
jgi:outer membrane protein assembly factor BamB